MKRLRGNVVRRILCLGAAGPTLFATTCAVNDPTTGGALGMCAPGFPDCVDVVVDDGGNAAGSACPVENPDCGDGTTAQE